MSKRRSRIQIGPGGVMYALATALIVGAAIYTQANLLFWAFGLMVGGLGVSLLLTWQMLRGIEVQRLLPGHGVAGDPLVIRYHLTNRAWLPIFGLVISETWGRGGRGWKRTGPVAQRPARLKGRPFGWVLHLGPHQTIQAEAPCWPLRRGPLTFERIVLSSAFPFGIIRKVVEVEVPASVLVYPHLYRMNRRLLYSLASLDPTGRKHIERGGGTEEFFGLRPYRAGDSLKTIDWKRSARTGELISREFTQPSPPRLLVLLDLRRWEQIGEQPAPPLVEQPPRAWWRRSAKPQRSAELTPQEQAVERAISLTASLLCESHFHGYQVGLAVAGVACTSFPVHHSLPHRTRMLEALAQLDPTVPGRGVTLPGQPSVIVWPGKGEHHAAAATSNGSAITLGAQDMHRYIHQGTIDSESLLHRRARPRMKREEITQEV